MVLEACCTSGIPWDENCQALEMFFDVNDDDDDREARFVNDETYQFSQKMLHRHPIKDKIRTTSGHKSTSLR